MRRLAPTLLPALAIVALVLGVFGRLAARPGGLLVDGERPSVDEAIAPDQRTVGNDLTRLFLPHHLRIAGQVNRLGRPSAWDPAGFGGRPRVGNPQAGLWYPPVWLAWATGSPASLGWLTVGHLIFAGVGAWWLARSLRLGAFAAFVTAGCFATAPYMLGQVGEGHLPHVWAACWYPWAFLAFVRWRSSADPRAALALPPILALCGLTGHPQEAFYLVLAMTFWVLFETLTTLFPRSCQDSRRSGFGLTRMRVRPKPDLQGPRIRGLALWIGLLGLALGLMAVEAVPVAMAQAWTLPAQRLSISQAGEYHVGPLNLLQLLTPRALGGPADYVGHDSYWETQLGCGWAALILAVVAVTRSPRRADVRPWLILAVVAVAFAAGERLGVFAVLYQVVPGMERFRVPARSLFLSGLAVAVLAGFGVEVLADRGGRLDWRGLCRRYRRLALGIATVVGLGAVVAAAAGVDDLRPDGDGERLLSACRRIAREPSFWVALGGVGAVLAWAAGRPGEPVELSRCPSPRTERRVRGPVHVRRRLADLVRQPLTPAGRGRGKAAIAVGILAIAELAWLGHHAVQVSLVERFFGPDPIAEAIGHLRPEGPFRIRAEDAYYPDLNAVAAGLEKTNINDYFQIGHAAEVYETLYPQFDPPWPMERGNPTLARRNRSIRRAVLDRMSVAFLVASRPPTDPLPWPVAATGTWRGEPFYVYRNPAPMPRAYVVPRAEPCPEPLAVAAFPAIPPREAVLMPSDPLGVPDVPRQPFTPARYDATDPDRVVVRVETGAPGLLVVADAWMPGWTAYVDGRPAPLLRGDRAWRVVPLPEAGSHEVVLRYRPPGLAMGGVLTAASATLWLVLAALATRRGSRQRRRVAAPATASVGASAGSGRPSSVGST